MPRKEKSSTAALGASSSPSCGAYLSNAKGLDVTKKGGFCGKFLAKCRPDECCDHMGRCGTGKEACGIMCQCTVSGKKSQCKGQCTVSGKKIPRKDQCTVSGKKSQCKGQDAAEVAA